MVAVSGIAEIIIAVSTACGSGIQANKYTAIDNLNKSVKMCKIEALECIVKGFGTNEEVYRCVIKALKENK